MRRPFNSPIFAAAEAAKGSAGPDAELASILAKVGEVPRTPPKTPEKKEISKVKDNRPLDPETGEPIGDDPDPEDDPADRKQKDKSFLGDALRKAADPDKGKVPEKASDAPEAKEKGKETPSDDYEKKLGDLDEKGVNPKVGEKFKRLKTESIALLREKDTLLAAKEAELVEAKKSTPVQQGEITEHPEYKKLQTALQEREAIIERLSLEESPAFKAAYTDKINDHAKKVVPILKMITDERTRTAVANGVDTLMRLDAGEEGDEKFYQGLGDLMEQSGLNAVQQSRAITELQAARDLINERQSKVQGHKEASKEFSSLEQAKRQELAKQAVSAVDAIRGQYQTGRAEKIGFYKKNEAIFGYDAKTSPFVDKLKAEIQKVATTGQLTPDLISFAHAGAETPFYMDLSDRLQALVVKTNQEKAELQKELDKLRGKDPSKGSKENGSRKETLNGKSHEDEEDPAKSGGSVMARALKAKAAAVAA